MILTIVPVWFVTIDFPRIWAKGLLSPEKQNLVEEAEMKEMKTVVKCLLGLFLLLAFVAACSPQPKSRSTGAYVDDKVITARVEAALIGNEQTKARQISIETYRGVVQLSGFVDSKQSKQVAEQVTRGVKGVVDVKNDLIVR
jgi:hypothetical protein